MIRRFTLAASAALAMMSLPLAAQTAAQVAAAPTLPGVNPQAGPAPTAPPMSPNSDLLSTSCGEFLSMLAVANPGQNPTQDRQSQAVRAQRDVFMLIIWANGYQTGKNRTNLAKAGMTKDWVTNSTAAIAKACKANPNQSFYQAAGTL